MPTDRSELVFDGAPELLEWLYALDLRPGPLTREKHSLPIVHLRVATPPGESRRLLAALQEHWTAHRLRGAGQCVMVAPSAAAPHGVEQLLAAAAAQFFQGNRLGRGRGAPHFALASWLATLRREQRKSLSEDEVVALLATHFAKYELFYEEGQAHREGAQIRVPLAAISDLPWWIKLPASVLPRLVLHVADTVFGPQRWFEHRGESRQQERHRNEPEPLKGSLFTLAKRFAGIEGPTPTQRQVNALLADALLEDLRRAYSRRGVFGRGRRRRTYPVLLLGCERKEATTGLLQAIKDVRNGRPRHGTFKKDPLLVVAAGPLPAADIDPGAREEAEPGSPASAHRGWHAELADASRPSRVWLLPFAIPANPGPTTVRDRLLRTRPPRRVPWMSFVGLALLIAGVVAVPVSSHEFCRPLWSPSVRAWPPDVLDAMTLEDLGDDGKQCVGFVGEDPPRVSDDLGVPIQKIKEANAQAVKNPDHITVVHLTMLSPGNEQDDRVAREELRGLVIAQEESLKEEAPIRLLLANAGANMEYADRAAQKIVEAARRDRRIVGVVGLGLSTRHTIEAVQRLGHAGLPSVGSATTADELHDASDYYYQVSPGNRRQANFAAQYAFIELKARRARLYYSADRDDIYSTELADALRDELQNAGVVVSEDAGYRVTEKGPGESVDKLGRNACQAADSDGIVVYAGRAERFTSFLIGMNSACRNNFPRILATDDVSRFVLEGTHRNYPGLRLDYIALATSAVWGTDCEATQRQSAFYISYNRLFEKACEENRDGQALLTYDALSVIHRAAKNVVARDADTLRSQGVVTGLPAISGEGKLSGVSGDLDYSDPNPDTRRAPWKKAIQILRATDNGPPCLVKVDGSIPKEWIRGNCPAPPSAPVLG